MTLTPSSSRLESPAIANKTLRSKEWDNKKTRRSMCWQHDRRVLIATQRDCRTFVPKAKPLITDPVLPAFFRVTRATLQSRQSRTALSAKFEAGADEPLVWSNRNADRKALPPKLCRFRSEENPRAVIKADNGVVDTTGLRMNTW